MSTFPPFTIRLDWSELDLFGHINNVAYFKYLQAARVSCWQSVGIDATVRDENGVGPLLAATSCQFRKALRFPGDISVHSTVSFIKTTSFGLTHRILNESGDLCAEGADAIVFFDYRKQAKTNIPADLRVLLEKVKVQFC